MKGDLTNLSSTIESCFERHRYLTRALRNLGASLQEGFAGFNFGGGLVPKGF